MKGLGWIVPGEWEKYHVVPIDDDTEHTEHDCACMPVLEEDMVIHNSYDGREEFERGERKVS